MFIGRFSKSGIVPDVVTDQTSAHDVLFGYIPQGLSIEEANGTQKSKPNRIRKTCDGFDGEDTSKQCSNFKSAAQSFSITVTICASAPKTTASKTPSIIPASYPPTFARCSAKAKDLSAGSRCRATKEDIYKTDKAMMNLFPVNDHLIKWLTMAQKEVEFQGLARENLLARLRRTRQSRTQIKRNGRVAASLKHQLSSAEIISTAAASPRPTAKPKR